MSRPAPSAKASAPGGDNDNETIHRVLFIAGKVHVYAIPPLQSTKGHVAAGWTTNPQHHIFTARLRVVESSSPHTSDISVTVVLEDPSSGELFAAAPYTATAAVEAATDSARFFALRVVGDGGRKATLGIGFEERGEALDFGLALTEARRALGWEKAPQPLSQKDKDAPRKDWGLKDGETLTVDLKGLRSKRGGESDSSGGGGDHAPSWSVPEGGGLVPPPPAPAGADLVESSHAGASGDSLLPPPPSAREARAERRRSREIPSFVQEEERKKLEALGFDDGEFGEFQ